MAIKAANDKSMSNITALPSGVSAKSMILLSTQTASSSATIDFTSGIDSTYKEYIFKFIGIHPQTDATVFQMNGSTDTGSNYNVTKTTTAFYAIHRESETTPVLEYDTGSDLAQSTAFSRVVSAGNTGNDNDQCCVGQMWLFNPSSTTFVKHFMAVGDTVGNSDYDMPGFFAGYFNTTTALTRFQFKFASGNIDAGTIKMYGVV